MPAYSRRRHSQALSCTYTPSGTVRKHQSTFTLGLASLKPLGNPTQPYEYFHQALPLSLSLPVPYSLCLPFASSANRSVLFLGISRILLYDKLVREAIETPSDFADALRDILSFKLFFSPSSFEDDDPVSLSCIAIDWVSCSIRNNPESAPPVQAT